MRYKVVSLLVILLIVALMDGGVAVSSSIQGVNYWGTVTVGGEAAVDGTQVTATLSRPGSDDLHFGPTSVSDGSYNNLVVAGGPAYLFGTVTFYVNGMRASPTVIFNPEDTGSEVRVDLVFEVSRTYVGTVRMDKGLLIGEIYAKVGDYESDRVTVQNGNYELTITPGWENIGRTVEFYHDGIKARETVTFVPGSESETLNLTFPAPGIAIWVWILVALVVEEEGSGWGATTGGST